MSERSPFSAESVVLAVIAIGLASFIVLYSLALLNASGERTRVMIRELWFLGLVAVMTLVALVRFYRSRFSMTNGTRDRGPVER